MRYIITKCFRGELLLLIIYFLFLLLIAPVNLLAFDTYYYWDWSRHLQLSYYDGSPLIAYFIWLSTFFFGNSIFALGLVGILVSAITSYIIYKTARLFLDNKASYVATFLWLFSPLNTKDILGQTTYDTPLTLFWSLTLYFSLHYIKTKQMRDLYWIGLSLGLLLLSKYSGIILLASLLIFIATTSYRYLFKSYHFYLAGLFTLLLFSPVLIWNYQHQWLSFNYQLSTHQLETVHNPVWNMLTVLVTQFIPSLNIMLFIPLCALRKNATCRLGLGPTIKKTTIMSVEPFYLLGLICAVFLGFYLIVAMHSTVRDYWLSQYLIGSALLGGYCFQRLRSKRYIRRTFYALISGYMLLSVGILLNNCLHFIPSKNFAYYKIIQQFNMDHPTPVETVFTSGWFDARILFFLNQQPMIYSLDCGAAQNQYGLWSKEMTQQIQSKTLQTILFIDSYDQIACLKQYFSDCQRISTISYQQKKVYELFVYRCEVRATVSP